MIVKVTSYVHAFKNYAGDVVYRIDSFKTPLSKMEATVCKTDVMVEIPDDFDLDKELRLTHSEAIKKELEFAESHVASLKKQLAGEA